MRLVESIRTLNNPDISFSLVPVSLWAVAEVSAGLVVGCLPLLPRFFGHRNVRTRLQASEPSEYSDLNSKGDSHSRVAEYDASLHSQASMVPSRPARANFVVMKSVRLDQTTSQV
jgi:hypothetical protein